jgi:hypothetical protein
VDHEAGVAKCLHHPQASYQGTYYEDNKVNDPCIPETKHFLMRAFTLFPFDCHFKHRLKPAAASARPSTRLGRIVRNCQKKVTPSVACSFIVPNLFISFVLESRLLFISSGCYTAII